MNEYVKSIKIDSRNYILCFRAQYYLDALSKAAARHCNRLSRRARCE